MRIVNRPVAFLVAVAMLAAGVLLIVEVVGYAINSRHVLIDWMAWQRWAERTQWNQAVIKTWSIILIAVGLLLLIIELKPPKATRIPLQSDHAATDAAISRKGLARALEAAATDVDGVRTASITISRSKATVAATSVAHTSSGADTVTKPLTRAVRDRLDGLKLAMPPRLRVTSRSS
jgi:Family of unknown function (DUF6286)